MKRRDFIALMAGAAVAWPFGARAQQTGKVERACGCIKQKDGGQGRLGRGLGNGMGDRPITALSA